MIAEKYRVTRSNNELLTPEETFIDTLSDHHTFEKSLNPKIFRLFFIIFFIACGFFLSKSFKLQVVYGSRHANRADRDNYNKYATLALRGIIYDDGHQPLVENIPVLDAIMVLGELPKDDGMRNALLKNVSSLLGMPLEELYEVIDKNKNHSTFIIREDIDKGAVIMLQTLKGQGIYTAAGTQRRYILGPAMSHILGYTSKVSTKDIESDPYYLLNDRIGRAGLEVFYEEDLRGNHSRVILGATENDPGETLKTGNSLVATIQTDIQKQLYQRMSAVLRANGIRRGGAVVQNVHTGAVLGLVSFPTYDPNIFEGRVNTEAKNKINDALTNRDRPLFDRIVSGRYSPGSTIKPLLALAGLEEGVVDENTTILANGSISVPSRFDPKVVYMFRDWKVHGLSDIRKAIADSVDIYFYALGGGYDNIKGLGIDRVTQYFKKFLIDQKTGIDLVGEVSGFIPTPDWKLKTKNEPWYIGDTYNVSIGQGDLGVTPLWLSAYTGALANGGKFMQPFIIREIRNSDDRVIKIIHPKIKETIPMNAHHIQIVQEGMRQTVTNGTAISLKDLPVKVAAKTGTAQVDNGKNLNSLLIVYGPYEHPEIAMSILIEDIPQSQSLAVQVAKDFLMWYFTSRLQETPLSTSWVVTILAMV